MKVDVCYVNDNSIFGEEILFINDSCEKKKIFTAVCVSQGALIYKISA